MRLAALLLLCSCSVNVDNWPEKYAKASCDVRERCSKAEFFYYYDDGHDCQTEYLRYWDDYGDATYASCDFDESKARSCLDELDASCKDIGDHFEDWDQDCYSVFDCSP